MKVNDNNYYIAAALCTPSKLPASDYVINPYVGCTHRCVYCYASFMSRFNGHSGEKWGSYLIPKKYSSMKLPRNIKGKTILIGSVTDAYNSAEKKFALMPQILSAIKDCGANIEILTKSNLVLRDIEILKNIPKITVGISLSNLSDKDNDMLEPGAASAQQRLEALKTLRESGIRTYLFISPYLPGITDINKIWSRVDGSVDYVCVENLNLRGAYKASTLACINKLHPELSSLYREIYIEGKAAQYWKKVENEIETLRKTANVPIISYMYHEKIKKK